MAKQILVVDDDDLIRDFMKEYLGKQGYQVTEAADGKEGLKKFRSANFDLVITDIVMPEMEGISFIRELREHNRKVPIIAMTGNIHGRMEEYLDISTKLGADAVLRKPVSNPELLKNISDLIG